LGQIFFAEGGPYFGSGFSGEDLHVRIENTNFSKWLPCLELKLRPPHYGKTIQSRNSFCG
jgi:hypothetical protein